MYISPIVFTTFISYCLCHFPPCWLPRSLFQVPSFHVDVLMILLLLAVPFSSCPIDCHGILLQLDEIFPVSTHVLLCIPHHPLSTRTSTLSFSHSHALRSSFVFLYECKEMFSWVNGLHWFLCGITRHPPSLYIPASPCHVLVSVSFRSSPFFPHIIVFCTNVKRCLRE